VSQSLNEPASSPGPDDGNGDTSTGHNGQERVAAATADDDSGRGAADER
jgi:hypothetical protein